MLISGFTDIAKAAAPGGTAVVLFSGGLDSSYLLARLREHEHLKVYALCVDLGGGDDLDAARRTAALLGAEPVVADQTETFAAEFVAPAIPAQAVYLGLHPVSSSLSRPLLARVAVDLAERVSATLVLHTANRSQNSLRRLNTAIGALGYEGCFGSPYTADAISREEKQRALRDAGLPEFTARTQSGDANLWCREFESGLLEDPEWFPVPDALYAWTSGAPPREPEDLTVDFDAGLPVALDGTPLPPQTLIAGLNRRAGRYGLGRYAGLEHIDSGEKVLEVREMPAACLLLYAYRQLEAATVPAETMREKLAMEQLWTREALEGRWFGPCRLAADAFIGTVARAVTGRVTVRLSGAGVQAVAIRARDPLYIRDRDAWERATAQGTVGGLT